MRSPRPALAAAGLVLALAACGNEASASAEEIAGTAAPVPTSGSSGGCPVGGVDIPADANVVEAGDLDGDGQDDQIWLGLKGDRRLLGVRTASGGSFSTAFTTDQVEKSQATAVANRLGDGNAVILLATGYRAVLYAVIGCEIVPTLNQDGNQYTFDLGMDGYGTGVACPQADEGLYLAGFNAEPDDLDSSDRVSRTRIDLSENGARADNGKADDLGNISYDSPRYKGASGVSCGDAETALEPER